MWERSFVAMTVLGPEGMRGTVDDALAGLASERLGSGAEANAALDALVARLRAPSRATRAAALADVGREIALAIEHHRLEPQNPVVSPPPAVRTAPAGGATRPDHPRKA